MEDHHPLGGRCRPCKCGYRRGVPEAGTRGGTSQSRSHPLGCGRGQVLYTVLLYYCTSVLHAPEVYWMKASWEGAGGGRCCATSAARATVLLRTVSVVCHGSSGHRSGAPRA
eukprot:1181848-Prorocentrum_minimum.AAC.3